MQLLFTKSVCWQKVSELAGYPATYLNLIVFNRGNGAEVVRTARTNWEQAVESGELRVAKVPEKYLGNLESLVYAKEELEPLIG